MSQLNPILRDLPQVLSSTPPTLEQTPTPTQPIVLGKPSNPPTTVVVETMKGPYQMHLNRTKLEFYCFKTTKILNLEEITLVYQIEIFFQIPMTFLDV